jgi:hypothetical protein
VQSLLELTPDARRQRAALAAIENLRWDARLAPLEDLLTAAVAAGK